MLWKIAGNQIENKGFQSKSTISAMQTMFKPLEINWKYEATWIYPTLFCTPIFIIIVSKKHNIFMKTCSKQKRSRFKFKVFMLKLKCIFASTWCVLVFPQTQILFGKLLIFCVNYEVFLCSLWLEMRDFFWWFWNANDISKTAVFCLFRTTRAYGTKFAYYF
jgi:hypothetical protein